jgi:hypothetical protein
VNDVLIDGQNSFVGFDTRNDRAHCRR